MSLTMQNRCSEVSSGAGRENGVARSSTWSPARKKRPGDEVGSFFSVTSPLESGFQLKQSRNAYGLGCASQYSKKIFTRQTCMKIWHQSESTFGHNCDKLTGRGFGKWKSDNSDTKNITVC